MARKLEEIRGSTKWLMRGTAIALTFGMWIIDFIPVVGEVVNEYIALFGNLLFLLWFWAKGASLFKKKRFLNFLGNLAGEELTFGVWPGFIVMVETNIYMHNKEVAAQTKNQPGEESEKVKKAA